MLTYPAIDPIAIAIGPIAIRWYGIMFIVAFASAWWLARRRASTPGSTWRSYDVDDLIFYGALGAIIGGRLGWVLFYGFEIVAKEPWLFVQVWKGGMSFHGGFLGVLIAQALFARWRGRRVADVFDFLAPLPGLGIAAVRCANFINGELWGKPTTSPPGFVLEPSRLHPAQAEEVLSLCERFDISACVLTLHASQLYEAVAEGLLLFILLWWFTSRPRPRLAPSGLFLIGYGTARFLVEFVRLPDANRGYLFWDWVTMGQLLSAPMLIVGVVLIVIAYRRRERSGNYE